MKHYKSIFLIFAIVIASTIVRGQDESFNEMYLKGKWLASCPVEIKDYASMHYCQLCPFIINSNKEGQVKDIEINFLADSLSLNQNGKKTTVPYTRNQDTHAISFALDSKQYNFRVFFDDKRRILVDSDGMIMVLEKAK